MKINQDKLAALIASNWSLVISSRQSFFGGQEHMLSLCNCGRQTLEFISDEEHAAQVAAEEWSGEWEGEGWYGRYNEAGDYQHIADNADEAIYRILSHDSSNNFSWRGNAEEAVNDAGRHRLIREALQTEGVIEKEESEDEYGMDEDDIATLADKVAEPYKISDGNATEYAATLEEAKGIVEDWYDYLVDDGKLDELPAPHLDSEDLDALCASVAKWENAIAEAMGKESFAGHGNYFVSAADRAGLSLTIEIRD